MSLLPPLSPPAYSTLAAGEQEEEEKLDSFLSLSLDRSAVIRIRETKVILVVRGEISTFPSRG